MINSEYVDILIIRPFLLTGADMPLVMSLEFTLLHWILLRLMFLLEDIMMLRMMTKLL